MNTEQIIKSLAEIKQILETQETSGSLHEIDKDIILEKLQKIYVEIKFSKNNSLVFNTPYQENKAISTEEIPPKREELLEIETTKPEITDKSNIQEAINTPAKAETIREETSKSAGSKTLADLYEKKAPLINEVLAERIKKKDLSSVLQSKPIESLERAIDVNAKFLFVKELFFNNLQLFEKTIRIIDSAATFNDAFNYLQQQFIWNYESETVQKFLELVRRRFIKDEL
ncbi:MAG: hypothetical protein N2662_05335 [Bacteroidales bacterium]|nr:hypothetical protein [Bacteroidales bacterium]